MKCIVRKKYVPVKRSVLFVHDDQMISRFAFLIEFRQKRINQIQGLIRNYKPTYDPRTVSLESLHKQLACEREALDALLTDLKDEMEAEFNRIRQCYLTDATQEAGNSDAES